MPSRLDVAKARGNAQRKHQRAGRGAGKDAGSKREPYAARLASAKQASLGQLLFKCARLYNEQALELANQRSGTQVRVAHTALFPHIDLRGTRLTVLAERVGVSKQAVSQLIDELEGFGIVERVPDPSDGRGRIVRFTRRGREGLLEGLEVLNELSGDLSQRLGNEQMLRDLHGLLQSLLGALEARADGKDS